MLISDAISFSTVILKIAGASFLGEIFRERRIRCELRVGLPMDVGQYFPALAIDVADSAKIDGEFFSFEGRTERMPGSIQLCRPRPDDPSLEFHHDLVCFFLDCDSQHIILCGNRGTKVRADTAKRVIHKEIKALSLWQGFAVELFWESDDVTETISRLGD